MWRFRSLLSPLRFRGNLGMKGDKRGVSAGAGAGAGGCAQDEPRGPGPQPPTVKGTSTRLPGAPAPPRVLLHLRWVVSDCPSAGGAGMAHSHQGTGTGPPARPPGQTLVLSSSRAPAGHQPPSAKAQEAERSGGGRAAAGTRPYSDSAPDAPLTEKPCFSLLS